MKWLVSGLFSLALLLMVVSTQSRARAAAASGPIAYINSQRILTESTQGKAASKQLDELRKAKAQEIITKQKALEETRLQLANSGGIFSASARARLKAQESQQQNELQRVTQESQNEFQSLQRQLQADLRKEFTGIVTEVANPRGIQLVLNADTAVAWASPTILDLTADILDRLNARAAQKPAK